MCAYAQTDHAASIYCCLYVNGFKAVHSALDN